MLSGAGSCAAAVAVAAAVGKPSLRTHALLGIVVASSRFAHAHYCSQDTCCVCVVAVFGYRSMFAAAASVVRQFVAASAHDPRYLRLC